jgi:hypothetical protein
VASFFVSRADGEADKWLEAAPTRRSQVLEDKHVSMFETSSRHLLDTTIGQVNVAS